MSSSIELVDSIRSCRYATVDELLNAFNSAAAAASLKDYFGCFASVDSRFLGTDSTENWTASDFYAYTKPHFTIGKGWTYIPRKETRKIDLFYNTQQQQKQPLYAYFDELLDSESFSLSRGTGVCEYDASLNCWFINSYHLTFAIPNGLAKGICRYVPLLIIRSHVLFHYLSVFLPYTYIA